MAAAIVALIVERDIIVGKVFLAACGH